MFREHSSFPQLQRLKVYNIMLLAISLLTTSRQRPLSIKIICKVHSCEKSNIIPFGYLSEKINLASFYVLYAAKAIYIPPDFSCRSEIVTKSSENHHFILGHLQNHHKFSNHVICIEELQNSLGLLQN